MLEHAFKFVDTVVFWVGETNVHSQHAVEKVGDVEIKWNLELLGVPIPGGASFD
jgi:hypothetical protein